MEALLDQTISEFCSDTSTEVLSGKRFFREMCAMQANAGSAHPGSAASLVLGRKFGCIPFSTYHPMIILLLGLVAFVDRYDLAMTGSLLVLAKEPLRMTAAETRLLAVAGSISAFSARTSQQIPVSFSLTEMLSRFRAPRDLILEFSTRSG